MRKISLGLRAVCELRSTYKEDARAIMEVNRPAAFCSNVANEFTPCDYGGYVAGGVLEPLVRMCA
jgi:hypothetical protein